MDNALMNNKTFSFTYSAEENKEIQEIRKKYLPQTETKLDELKRLDAQVQNSGTVEALCVGIISCLVFGTGMCLAMQVIGSGILAIVCGVLIGMVGMAGMLTAYPVYRSKKNKTKERLAPRILELADELSNN